eukprot:scaffold21307_cov66-Phaeocystis_antarctica.AAC.4
MKRPRLFVAPSIESCRAALAISDVERAGAGGGADAARGRQQDGLLRRVPHQARPAQALPGTVEVRWQEGEPGLLRHGRGGGTVRRAIAEGAGGGGAGCSGIGEGSSGAAADERGGAAAGAGGGADAARGQEQDGLLLRERAPGRLRYSRGGGAVHRALAGGAGGGGEGSSGGGAADERGGAAAGAGGGTGTARGRQQDGLLRRVPLQSRPAQAPPGAGVAPWQGRAPGPLRHRRGGGALRRAVAGGAGGGAAGGGERGGPGQPPRYAVRRIPQGGGHGPADAARRLRQGRGGGPAYASRRVLQGGGRRPAHAARCGCQRGARGRRQGGGALGWPTQEA